MIISFDEVKKIWNKNIRPVVLYLHNPFCNGMNGKNCKYCVHRGYVGASEEEVNKFYFDIMPKRLDAYKDIIKNQDIKLVSFGGGTPNYLDSKRFDNYMKILEEKIPNFTKLPKIIELHPFYVNKEYIDCLYKWGFTTLIFCFQTFSNEMLTKQNRINYDFKKIEKNVKYSKELGFSTSGDIMTFWDNNFKEWAPILDDDLLKASGLDLDEITISPLYQSKFNKNFNIGEAYDCIRSCISSKLYNYYNPEMSFYNKDFATIRMFKNKIIPKDWDLYLHSLTDFGWFNEHGVSTLGIGNYKNADKGAYSIIGPNYTIYEKDGEEDFSIKYDLVKKYNFWNSIRNIIDRIEKEVGEEVPVGTEIFFRNICQNDNNGFSYQPFKQGDCIWNISNNCIPCDNEFGKNLENKFNKIIDEKIK